MKRRIQFWFGFAAFAFVPLALIVQHPWPLITSFACLCVNDLLATWPKAAQRSAKVVEGET